MRSRRDSTPTLLCRMSSPPQRDTACSTIARQSAARVTSAAKACAIPPSPEIAFTVSSARSGCASTQSTFAPSRAKRIDAALPLPMPGPREPAPVTIATLSFRRPAIKRSGGFGGFLVFALLLHLRGAFLLLFLRLRRRRLFRAVHQHDERKGRVVALPETALEDAQVPAVALGIARPEILEQLLDDVAVAQAVEGEAPVGERGLLAEGDHRLDDASQLFRLGQRGADLLMAQQRYRHVAQHRQPMARGAVELAKP